MPRPPLTAAQAAKVVEHAANDFADLEYDEPGQALPYWRVWFDLGELNPNGPIHGPRKTAELLRVRNPYSPKHEIPDDRRKQKYRRAYAAFSMKVKEAKRIFDDNRLVRQLADADEVRHEIETALHTPYDPGTTDEHTDYGYREDER